jgi:hypothetical protein
MGWLWMGRAESRLMKRKDTPIAFPGTPLHDLPWPGPWTGLIEQISRPV